MMRADALRAACVAAIVTFAILLLSLSGCTGDFPSRRCTETCAPRRVAATAWPLCWCAGPDGGAR
jgi:hypothetical protein